MPNQLVKIDFDPTPCTSIQRDQLRIGCTIDFVAMRRAVTAIHGRPPIEQIHVSSVTPWGSSNFLNSSSIAFC